jgi:hypothetical protein
MLRISNQLTFCKIAQAGGNNFDLPKHSVWFNGQNHTEALGADTLVIYKKDCLVRWHKQAYGPPPADGKGAVK